MKRADIISAAEKQGLKHIIIKKTGVIRVMKPYFYRSQAGTIDALKTSVVKAFPEAQIIDDGDYFTSFRGGAPVAKQSHIWVEFKMPSSKKQKGQQEVLDGIDNIIAKIDRGEMRNTWPDPNVKK